MELNEPCSKWIDILMKELIDVIPKEIIEHVITKYLFRIELKQKLDYTDGDLLLSMRFSDSSYTHGLICANKKVYFHAKTIDDKISVWVLDTTINKCNYLTNAAPTKYYGMIKFEYGKILICTNDMLSSGCKLVDISTSQLVDTFRLRNIKGEHMLTISSCKNYLFTNKHDSTKNIAIYRHKLYDANFWQSNHSDWLSKFITLNIDADYVSIITIENKLVIITDTLFIFGTVEPYKISCRIMLNKRYRVIGACHNSVYVFVLCVDFSQKDSNSNDVKINNGIMRVYNLQEFMNFSTTTHTNINDIAIDSMQLKTCGYNGYNQKYAFMADGNDLVICNDDSFRLFDILS